MQPPDTSLGSKYTKYTENAPRRKRILVYLKPKERVWWLQMLSYFS